MSIATVDDLRRKKKLDRLVRRKKSDYKIINKQIANRLSVSERGILYKRKTGFYTFDELIKLFDYLGFTDEEIASVFRR